MLLLEECKVNATSETNQHGAPMVECKYVVVPPCGEAIIKLWMERHPGLDLQSIEHTSLRGVERG